MLSLQQLYTYDDTNNANANGNYDDADTNDDDRQQTHDRQIMIA